LKTFEGKYKNRYNDEVEIFIKDNALIYKQFGRETKLVRISETDFLPEKDQSFKISFDHNQMSKFEIQGDEKFLFKGHDLSLMSVPSFNKLDTNKLGEKPYLIEATISYATIARSLGFQPALTAQTKHSDTPSPPLSKKEVDTEKPIKLKQESQHEPSTKNDKVQYDQPKIS
jgi:hypothetical protein